MLHAHSRKPTKFQNINYEIKLSDFIPAKCFTIRNSDFHQNPDSEADDALDRKKLEKNSDINLSPHSDESDSSDNEDSVHDNQDDTDQEVTVPHVDHSFELEGSSNEERLENDENDGTEEDLRNVHQENNVHEDQHVPAPAPESPASRPQRKAKVAAYRDKIWLHDEQDDDYAMGQIDGNLITLLITTPEKENDELEKTKSNSTNSSKNFHWNNYCSSPELTGYPWEVEETY